MRKQLIQLVEFTPVELLQNSNGAKRADLDTGCERCGALGRSALGAKAVLEILHCGELAVWRVFFFQSGFREARAP